MSDQAYSPPPLPDSLWAATARPAPPTPPLEGEQNCDVVVVGGGFTGLSAALHAAEGGADVLLLEQAEPGFGASGRNGGQVIAGFKLDPDALIARFGQQRGERLARFAGDTADLVFDLIERHAIDCDAARCGWIQGMHTSKLLPLAESRQRQWRAYGSERELLDRERMTALTGAQGYAGGLLDPRGGRLNPLGYARGLARAALTAGARLHSASPAQSLQPDGDGWRITTPRGQVRAKQVLLCTNGYSDDLWPGLKRSVITLFSYQIATRPLSDNLRRSILPEGHVVSDTRRLLTYFRFDPEGRLVVGGRGAFRDTSDPRHFGHVRVAMNRLFPHLEPDGFDFHWAGKVAMTLSHLPHLDELAPGVTAALGFNGRGVAMATAMGTVLAQRVLGMPLSDLVLPARPVRPVPLHGLRRPMISVLVAWKRFRDQQESGR